MRTRIILIALTGCLAASATLAQTSVTAADLQHHRWVLDSINGEPLPETGGEGKVPELDFGEQMHVSGNLGCNRFNGTVALRDGSFLVENMVSTRMMCAPPWSDIERDLQTALGSASTLTLDADGNLRLAAPAAVYHFRLEDWVRAAASTGADSSAVRVSRGFRERGSRMGYTNAPPPFGGRNSPAGEIDEVDTEIVPAFRFPTFDDIFDPWTEWKRTQNVDHGLQLSAHYSTLFQFADDVIGPHDKATGGVLRGTVRWTMIGRDTPNHGSLNVMLDHRHAYRSETPANFAGQIGYIGQTGVFYNDMGFAVINLNWQQALRNGKAGVIVGRFDPNDYQNVLGYVNPWTIFSNLAINLDTSIALPDSSWGIAGGTFLTDQVYIMGGINDANGNGGDNLEFFDGGSEFYKFAHVGWTPSKDERYFKNIHVMAWHVDDRTLAGIPSAHGIAIAANWTFDDRWMPFVRLGFSKGSAPIYNESVTLGLIHKFRYRSDLIGLAANHGSPPDSSLKDQTSIEAFWRIQFSENLAITPSVQLIVDPALNPVDDQVWVYGARFRLTF